MSTSGICGGRRVAEKVIEPEFMRKLVQMNCCEHVTKTAVALHYRGPYHLTMVRYFSGWYV